MTCSLRRSSLDFGRRRQRRSFFLNYCLEFGFLKKDTCDRRDSFKKLAFTVPLLFDVRSPSIDPFPGGVGFLVSPLPPPPARRPSCTWNQISWLAKAAWRAGAGAGDHGGNGQESGRECFTVMFLVAFMLMIIKLGYLLPKIYKVSLDVCIMKRFSHRFLH